MAATLTPANRQAALQLLTSLLARRGVDTRAANSVFGQEGASGRVGDGGHAFGPGQFNDAGGVWTGRYPGLTPDQKNEKAWSPAGITELADRVAKVAGGLHGPASIKAIVSQFERPADPGGEISRALAAYGGNLGGGASPAAFSSSADGAASATDPTSADPGARRRAVLSLISSFDQKGGSDSVLPLLQAIKASRQTAASANSGTIPESFGNAGKAAAPTRTSGSIAELLQEGTGGPTHSTGPHVHLATKNAKAMLAALAEGKRLGLTALENPYVDPVNPGVHSEHSFHKADFPGLYNGRTLGQATDFSGNPAAVQQLLAWIKQHLS